MQADVDNSGTIDYGEFIAAMLHLHRVDKEDHLCAAFAYFDKDGSGYITKDELQQACREFGMEEIHVEEIIHEADQDKVRFFCSLMIIVKPVNWNKFINQIEQIFLRKRNKRRVSSHCYSSNLTSCYDFCYDVQDGRIDYNEFVAMMQRGNVDLGRRQKPSSAAAREARQVCC